MSDLLHSQKKYFISFADSRMSAATTRIAKQAEEMNFFDEIHVMNESSLNPEFREHLKVKLRPGVRGFGYWCWKPQIIKQTLEQLEDGDLLFYCDAGCHLNLEGLERLKYYVEETNRDSVGIKAFPAVCYMTDVLEKRWTKGDVFDYFKCRERKEITDTPQLAAGHVFIRKSHISMAFVNEWSGVCLKDFSLIDDSSSKSPNLPTFLEGRHDQSIFSVLYKLYGATPLPDGETENRDFSQIKHCPIWDVRNLGYKDMRFWARVKRWTKGHILLTKIRWEKLKERLFSGK